MSSVGKAIYTMLSSDATLAGIFSNRIYPATVPARTAMPCLVYTKISATPTNDKDGTSVIDEEYFQIDIYTPTYDQNHTAAERVRAVLDRVRNTVAGVAIDHVVFEGENDGAFDPALDVYWVSQDYRFRVRRAGSVAATAQYFSQEFSYAQLSGGNTATITENGGVLPSNSAAITVLVDVGGGTFVFNTDWTASSSQVTLNTPLPSSGRMLVLFVVSQTNEFYRQIFTGLTSDQVTVTANGGVLPSNSAAITAHLNGVFTTEYSRAGAVFTLPYNLQSDWQFVVTFYI